MMTKMMTTNSSASTMPAYLITFFFPMLRRIVQLFSPTLGFSVDVGVQAAKEMQVILEVGEQDLIVTN